MQLARLSVLILPLTLTNCVTTTGSSAPALVTKVACGAFQSISWSQQDTAKTIAQVKEHNAAGVAIGCWKRPQVKVVSDYVNPATFKQRWALK